MSKVPENIEQLLRQWKPVWYYHWFPFLPRFINDKQLRLFTVKWRDCSYTAKAVGKPHLIDLLVANHKTPWFKSKLAGFQVWY